MSATSRTTRAGLPTTTLPSGTSSTTTDPAPTRASPSDDHARQERGVRPDLGPFADERTAQRFLDTDAERVARVGEHDVRSDPRARFEDAELGDERVRMDPDAVGDPDVMLDDRVRADADVVADLVRLADEDPVAGLESSTDHRTRVQDGVRPDVGAVADHQGQFAVKVAAGREPEHDIGLDGRARSEHGVGVDDRGTAACQVVPPARAPSEFATGRRVEVVRASGSLPRL